MADTNVGNATSPLRIGRCIDSDTFYVADLFCPIFLQKTETCFFALTAYFFMKLNSIGNG